MTDPRIEAAARALCNMDGYSPDGDYITPINYPEMDVNWKVYEEEACAAIAAADAAAWRPIESAPMDGTHILVPMKFIGADVVAYDLGAWRETTNMLRLKDEPTHWQPLPAPPASIDALGGRDG